MLESLVQFHDHLPLMVRLPLDFIVQVIIIRGILANEILEEMRQRGFLKHGFLHDLLRKMEGWGNVVRKLAIVQHYREGHGHDTVVGCGQGRCGVFTQA